MQQTLLKSTQVFSIYSQHECHNFSIQESVKAFFFNNSLTHSGHEREKSHNYSVEFNALLVQMWAQNKQGSAITELIIHIWSFTMLQGLLLQPLYFAEWERRSISKSGCGQTPLVAAYAKGTILLNLPSPPWLFGPKQFSASGLTSYLTIYLCCICTAVTKVTDHSKIAATL